MREEKAVRYDDEMFTRYWVRATAGSARDVADLLNLYRPYLKSLASRELDSSLRNKEGSSDLVQQTMIDGQAGFVRCEADDATTFRLWLRQILLNNLRDVRRRFRSQRRDISKERSLHDPASATRAMNVIETTQPTPASAAMDREHRELLRHTLNQLAPEVREVIFLRYRDGLGYREIAQRIGRPTATAHHRVREAIASIKKAMKGGTR